MSCISQTEDLITPQPNAGLSEPKMQAHIGNNCLRRVYYVDGEGSDLVPVPAQRLVEAMKLRSEQHQRQSEASMVLSAVRRA